MHGGPASRTFDGQNGGMAFIRRVMVADFDSVRQKDLWQREGEAEANRRLTAMLRLACLLEGRLILTDSQLLDGIYFVTHGPDDVAGVLGCDPGRIPLTVSVEAKFQSLEESLRAKTADPVFEWSSQQVIPPGPENERRRLVEMQSQRRAEWLAAVEMGRLERGRFERFSFEVFEQHWEATPWSTRTPGSRVLPSSLEEIGLRGCIVRSHARDLIEDNIGPLSDPFSRLIYQRWDAAYQSALAACNDASWMYFSRGAPQGETSIPGAVRLDGTLLDQLADIDGPVNALVSHRARSAVEKWRQNPESAAVHNISFAVTDTLTRAPSRTSAIRGALFRLLTPMLLSLAVLLVALGGSWTRGWASVAAVCGFIAAVPWTEIPTILRARKGRLRAVIRVESQ
jgi:hypothetical protein